MNPDSVFIDVSVHGCVLSAPHMLVLSRTVERNVSNLVAHLAPSGSSGSVGLSAASSGLCQVFVRILMPDALLRQLSTLALVIGQRLIAVTGEAPSGYEALAGHYATQ